MGLTTPRTIGIALGAFALLVVARPPRPVGEVYDASNRQQTPLSRANSALTATNDTARVLQHAMNARQLQDSVDRWLAHTPPLQRNQIVVDSRLPLTVRQHLQLVYAASRAGMAGDAVTLPVFVVLDSSRDQSEELLQWVESTTAGAPSCVTIARIKTPKDALIRDTRAFTQLAYRVLRATFPQPRHFGLCGFEAAFGQPSRVVRQWLQARELYPSSSGFDLARPARLAVRRQYDQSGLDYSEQYFMPWWGGDEGISRALNLRSCASGRLLMCIDAAVPRPKTITVAVGDTTVSAPDGRSRWQGSPDVMNALATSLGQQRFAELWRADAPPPASYERLTGVPMDTLARRLLYGDAAPLRAGAAPTLAEILAALVIAAALAGLATLSHPRRRR